MEGWENWTYCTSCVYLEKNKYGPSFIYSFDPTRDDYVHWPHAGAYVSNMSVDIPSYLILFKDLDKTFQHPDVLEMVRLSAFHDIMAFLAVSYRNTIMAGLKIIDGRHSAVNTLKRYLRSTTHALRHPTIHILICLAKTVMPASPAPPPPPQQQRRLSVAVTSRIHASIIKRIIK